MMRARSATGTQKAAAPPPFGVSMIVLMKSGPQDHAMAGVPKLVEELSRLTLLEATELAEILKKKWRPLQK